MTRREAAFLLALDGTVVGWGEGVTSLFGHAAGELVGHPVAALVPAGEKSAFPRILRAVARGESVTTDQVMVASDGLRIDAAVEVFPARNGEGRITGARAVVRDVSARRAEEAQGRLAALIEAIHDAVYTLDERSVIRSWSPGAERLYGYDAFEAVGLPALSLVPDADYADAQLGIECVLAGEPVQLFDARARRKDAVVVPVNLNLWPVRDRRGRVTGVSVIARDLTEERLAEAALAEREVRLRESESLAQVGGWVWDVATGAVQWSEELHRIYGLDPASFAGTLEAHLEPVHPDEREKVRAAMYAALTTPEPFELEFRIVRPDGRVRHLYSRAEVALASADAVAVAGLRGICQDVTARAQAAGRAEDGVRGRLRAQLGPPLERALHATDGLTSNGGAAHPEVIQAVADAVRDASKAVEDVLGPGRAASPTVNPS